MKKFTKASTVLMLTMAMIFTFGCKPEDDPNGEGGSEPTTEGIYLGVIGFNYNLYTRNIGLLNSSTQGNYISFIEDLEMDNLTGLYYADYTALQKLQSYSEPPKLTNVALVTFTDGLDNASLDDDKNPENYPTRDAYLAALHNKIKTEKVHGKEINAYTIGLKGNDVQDVTAFRNNLQKLASSNDNVFEVTSMDEAIQRFAEIAESLHSINTSTSLSLLVPPGYDDGLVLRFTFDWIGSAENSSLYLECTYKRTENGRRLDNITYHGFKQGATSLSSVEKLGNGFYKFVFENLKKEDNSFITESDKDHLKLYRQIPTGWEPETEFDNNNQSSVTEEHSSALIMLVLDCTTSLGNQFSSLKTGATRFVETLVSSTGNGNGGGNNGGGLTTNYFIDFEDGDFGGFEFENDPYYPWFVTGEDSYEGVYCMKSSNGGVPDSNSSITATVTFGEGGHIQFNYKCLGESGYDFGYLLIDGVEVSSFSSEYWTEYSTDVNPGTHRFTWVYTKDGSYNSNGDCLYIDNIHFTNARHASAK